MARLTAIGVLALLCGAQSAPAWYGGCDYPSQDPCCNPCQDSQPWGVGQPSYSGQPNRPWTSYGTARICGTQTGGRPMGAASGTCGNGAVSVEQCGCPPNMVQYGFSDTPTPQGSAYTRCTPESIIQSPPFYVRPPQLSQIQPPSIRLDLPRPCPITPPAIVVRPPRPAPICPPPILIRPRAPGLVYPPPIKVTIPRNRSFSCPEPCMPPCDPCQPCADPCMPYNPCQPCADPCNPCADPCNPCQSCPDPCNPCADPCMQYSPY